MTAGSRAPATAAPSVPPRPLGPARSTEPPAWHAHHIFYHGDRPLLLRKLLRPLLASLVEDGRIDRFFFINYALGGPHVRLRWRAVTDPGQTEAELRRATADFFCRWPSTESIPEEEILRRNVSIIADDPLAGPEEAAAFPDNSLRRFPFRFEVERYGGEAFLDHSLDLFTFSSVKVLELLEQETALSRGQALSRMLRLVVEQAWGLAEEPRELIDLVGYGVNFMGAYLPGCVEQGDRVYAQRRDQFRQLLERQLEDLAEDAAAGSRHPLSFAEAGRRFAREIRDLPYETRWFIGASHIHMTANRLGFFNPEEVYLCRLLRLAIEELVAARPSFWHRLWQSRTPAETRPEQRLADLMPLVLDRLSDGG